MNYKETRKFERKVVKSLCFRIFNSIHRESIIQLIRSTKKKNNGYTYISLKHSDLNVNSLNKIINELKNLFSENISCFLYIPKDKKLKHQKLISLKIQMNKPYCVEDLNTYYKMKNIK